LKHLGSGGARRIRHDEIATDVLLATRAKMYVDLAKFVINYRASNGRDENALVTKFAALLAIEAHDRFFVSPFLDLRIRAMPENVGEHRSVPRVLPSRCQRYTRPR
jgi:hypothetical protein